MQELLKKLLSELHNFYFKPNGFRKKRQCFYRKAEGVTQEIDFQSSQWNSVDSPITFYVNLHVGFDDCPLHGKPALAGTGRISNLASKAPAQYDLTPENFSEIRDNLILLLPEAIRELPKHYEDIRTRAKRGYFTPIPLPDTWRT